jgi:hypothetical protein
MPVQITSRLVIHRTDGGGCAVKETRYQCICAGERSDLSTKSRKCRAKRRHKRKRCQHDCDDTEERKYRSHALIIGQHNSSREWQN